MTAPDWAIAPWPGIHEVPGEFTKPQPPMSWAQVQATTRFMVDTLIGQIAVALGGINILGWQPLDFLADWGRQRIIDARNNYETAIVAQDTANRANSQITAIIGVIQASDVPGGISIGDQFTGYQADNLGPGFTLTLADGPGAGRFSLDGNGHARWAKSGGTWRRNMYTGVTPMATDYHMVYTVISSRGQDTQAGTDPALAYLTGRGDAAGRNFVWLGIRWDGFEAGVCTNGVFRTDWSQKATINAGDQVALICGGSIGGISRGDIFYVKHNGILIPITTIKSPPFGEGYRRVGVGARATARDLYFNQTAPASLDMWSACDRQPTTL